MALLEWSDALRLGEAAMDDTHREFVELLNGLGAAAEGELLARLDAFIAHTEAHFGQEERWMEAMNFPPLACHRTEHRGVLEVMREVRNRVAAGEPRYGAVLAKAIAEWFPLHAQSMDAVLALAIRQAGFDTGAAAGEGSGEAARALRSPAAAAESRGAAAGRAARERRRPKPTGRRCPRRASARAPARGRRRRRRPP